MTVIASIPYQHSTRSSTLGRLSHELMRLLSGTEDNTAARWLGVSSPTVRLIRENVGYISNGVAVEPITSRRMMTLVNSFKKLGMTLIVTVNGKRFDPSKAVELTALRDMAKEVVLSCGVSSQTLASNIGISASSCYALSKGSAAANVMGLLPMLAAIEHCNTVTLDVEHDPIIRG